MCIYYANELYFKIVLTIFELTFNKNVPQRLIQQEKQAAQIFRNVVMSSLKQMRENFPDKN